MVYFLIATAIFLLTITLIIWPPKGQGIGTIALAGALATLATGLLDWQDLISAWDSIGKILLSVLAVIIVASILKEAGFFQRLAKYLIMLGANQGRRLFWLLNLGAALISILFTSYSSVLLWTPVILSATKLLRFRPKQTLVYALATGWTASVTSLLVPQANPVNLITTELSNISWLRYSLVVVPLEFVALVCTLALFQFYFAHLIPETYSAPQHTPAMAIVRDPLVCRWSFVPLGLLLISSFWADWYWLIAIVAALFALLLASRFWQPSPAKISLLKLIVNLPWQIIGFSLGISIVVLGLNNAGMMILLSDALASLSRWGITLAATGTGFLAMVLSGLMHNLPVSVINIEAIQDAFVADKAISEAMIYANLLGGNFGAKISPLGSISTLLWLSILKQYGLRLRWSEYLRIHTVLVIPVLVISLLSLTLWLPWLIA